MSAPDPLNVVQARFTRILIVQSLPPEDGAPGRRLRDELEPLTLEPGPQVAVDLTPVESRAELEGVLRDATRRATNEGDRPVLHLECHGGMQPDGIQLADGTFLLWEELKPMLTDLNVATRCNLFVTLASCWGAALGRIVTVDERAPVLAYVGATDAVPAGQFADGFTAFYRCLLSTLDGTAAIRELRTRGGHEARYFFMSAPTLLVNACRRLSEQMDAAAIEFRARTMRQKLLDRGVENVPSIAALVELWSDQEPRTVERIARRFLMLDLYPENAARFPAEIWDVARGRDRVAADRR